MLFRSLQTLFAMKPPKCSNGLSGKGRSPPLLHPPEVAFQTAGCRPRLCLPMCQHSSPPSSLLQLVRDSVQPSSLACTLDTAPCVAAPSSVPPSPDTKYQQLPVGQLKLQHITGTSARPTATSQHGSLPECYLPAPPPPHAPGPAAVASVLLQH